MQTKTFNILRDPDVITGGVLKFENSKFNCNYFCCCCEYCIL